MAEKKIAGRGVAADGCAELFSRFAHEGSLESAEPYGSGHIHETLLLKTRERNCPDYILQRVNHHIFKDVPRLMENIVRVTGHLRRKIAAIPGSDPDREVLTVVPARDGNSFHRDGDGNFWRCYLLHRPPAAERPGKGSRARPRGGEAFWALPAPAGRPAGAAAARDHSRFS